MKVARTVEPRFDTAGALIQEHDVLRDEETGEMALVVRGKNSSGVEGLGVVNEVTGVRDWLDVYPDGIWTIVGNFGVSAEVDPLCATEGGDKKYAKNHSVNFSR